MYATAKTARTDLNPRDASPRTWSTSSVAPDEAAAYWRDVVRQLCVQMGIEPTPGTAFCGEIRRREYGDFALAVSRASGGTWRRPRTRRTGFKAGRDDGDGTPAVQHSRLGRQEHE